MFSSYFSKQKFAHRITKILASLKQKFLNLLKRPKLDLVRLDQKKLTTTKITSKSEAIFVWLKSNLRTGALLLIAGIAVIANFDQGEASFRIGAEPNLTESIAISTPDLEKTLVAIDPYTPAIDEKPQAVTGEIVSKITLAMASGDFLLKPHILAVQTAELNEGRDAGFIYHVVKEDETLDSICSIYKISQDTVKIANNISDPNVIRVGMRLLIPPTDGVVHIVVRGENLSDIVTKYQGNFNQTLRANNLGKGRTIFAGQRLIIVGGKTPAPVVKPPVRIAAKTPVTSVRRGTCANRFPFGWCTWYVASKRCVPWSGNAGAWPRNAQALGYKVGRTPVVGAILVTHESWWGHVAYVESVNGSTITISEMNFVRWGKVSRRTVSANYGVYIY